MKDKQVHRGASPLKHPEIAGKVFIEQKTLKLIYGTRQIVTLHRVKK